MINSAKYSLIGLFNPSLEDNAAPIKSIEIPIIQRDYAQGRDLPDVNRIRTRFLSSLYDALTTSTPITLDFVYGDIDENGTLIPLDGQQRLTTLFLLHWYIARHELIEDEKLGFLSKFTYATRYSAREFCQKLVSSSYVPNMEMERISSDITDQSWMPRDWHNDPTISAMLNMLDDIHLKFKHTMNLWENLENGCISFYFLSIPDLGATDDLYIKMNSRGKPLTEFEHFKAEWEGCLKKHNKELARVIGNKVDLAWTDLLWPYRDSGLGTSEDHVIDDEFVRYFRFLADSIIIENNSEIDATKDIFTLTKELFDSSENNSIQNAQYVLDGFDCWVNEDIEYLFESVFTSLPGEDTTKCVISEPLNIFEEACHFYGHQQKGQRRKFPIGRMVLLHAFVYYLCHKDSIKKNEFARRIRIITNLIKGSEFELREDNLSNLYKQTNYILTHGDIEDGYPSFGLNQLIEEHDKVMWLKDNEDKYSLLCKLENHPLLQGATRVLGLDHIEYVERFYSLFRCDWSLVNRALLSIGDYSLFVNWRYQIGTKSNETSWRSIFRTKEEDITETRRVLLELLAKNENFTNAKLQQIIDEYLNSTNELNWRYYVVKYDSMRPERYGMYYWKDYASTQKSSYQILMMWTEKSIGGRNHNIFLKTIYDGLKGDNPNLSVRLGEYAYSNDGNRLELLFINKLLYFTNNSIVICHVENREDGSSEEVIDSETLILQSENGIDQEDRIILCMNLLSKLLENEHIIP